MTERTIILPTDSAGNGNGSHFRLTAVVPKRRFLSYLRERWWVVLICLAGAVASVLVYETVRAPGYRSFAQLYVSSDAAASPLGFLSEDSQNYFGTQIELLKSARLQNTVYEQLGVAAGAKKQMIKVAVTQPLRTSLLNVQATGADPELVRRFLQSLITEYLSYKKQTRLASSEDLLNSITEEVARKAASLQSEQEKWAEFQKTNNVAVLEEDGKSAGLYLSDLNLQLAKLRLEHKILSEVSAGVSASPVSTQTNQAPVTNSASSGLGSTGTTNQVSQDDDAALKSARVQLAVMLSNKEQKLQQMGPRNFEQEIARLQQFVAILENEQKSKKAMEIQDLEKRIAAILEAIPSWETKMLDINQRLAQAQQIKSSVARQQEFYDHLLGTMQNVDLNKNVQQERLSLLQPATPAAPENRSLPFRIALAAVGGLAFSLGIVFLWYLLDDRLVSVRDINDQFGEAVLGLVPQIRVPRDNPEKALIEDDDSRAAYAESFRHLRSALLLSKPSTDSPSQVLLFTSAMPDEGKTTVAVNVARVLARSGLRVALVDADLQSAGNRKFFGDPDGNGLINFLRGEVEMDAVLRASEIPGLTIASRGARNSGTEGLFLRSRLEDLIKHLRGQNDFVILDAAPVLSSDDSALLVPHADSVVLVTRPFYTRSRLIRRALDMLYQRRAKQVTLVLNRARADDLAGYYAENSMRNEFATKS